VIGYATTADAGASTSTGAGVALCVAAAFLYAAGVTFQKPALRSVSSLHLTWLASLVGGIACLPFAPTLIDELTRARVEKIAWLAYLGVFATSIGFTTWAFALSRMSAGRAGATTYLIPPTAILIGWLVLGEAPATLAIAGGVLCIVGVFVARSTGIRLRAALRRRKEVAATKPA
jgi:drug/metabolite transporter (DMT)-like permease